MLSTTASQDNLLLLANFQIQNRTKPSDLQWGLSIRRKNDERRRVWIFIIFERMKRVVLTTTYHFRRVIDDVKPCHYQFKFPHFFNWVVDANEVHELSWTWLSWILPQGLVFVYSTKSCRSIEIYVQAAAGLPYFFREIFDRFCYFLLVCLVP
jgi:hypothetical protein